MATKVDYYEVLEVTRTASQAELKTAYRKMAMRFHPDRNAGNAEAEHKFKQVNEAYDVLKDEQKRAAYDRYGHAAFDGSMGGGGGFGGFGAGGFEDIFDMFGDMMGGGRRRTRQRSGNDVQTQVHISLTEAFSGVKKTVKFATRVTCESCSGRGSADPNKGTVQCPTCHGAGAVRAQQGFFLVERPCPTCHGTGNVISDPCKKCQGAGTTPTQRELDIDIPAGIEDGTRMRVTGEGEAGGPGAQAGDLYLHIAVATHALFHREGANIHCRLPLRMAQAALGAEIEVPVIDGSRAKVKIPAGSQAGDHFRLKGKGFSVLRSSSRGDMYLQLAVETPRHLTKRQRELLEAFEEEASENQAQANPESTGFFSKVKEFFDGR